MVRHEHFESLLGHVNSNSVFVEIGSTCYENSTEYLGNLSKKYSVDFLTVDIENKTDLNEILKKPWQTFYRDVRDQQWPESVASINDLPQDLQLECINQHGWNEIEKTALDKINRLYRQQHVKFYHDVGSTWAKNYKTNIGRPISLLYLDNFDYIWQINTVPDFIKDQITQYRENWNIDMNNQQCQIEHLTQLIHLEPFFDQGCVIGFDDTYLYNDCWIGKCGPAVVYLLTLGYKIVLAHQNTVFLKK